MCSAASIRWQLTMTTRVSVIVTPRASVQVFMQPLLATGDYRDFKELARPRTFDFLEYGMTAGAIAYDPVAATYAVDPDGAAPRRHSRSTIRTSTSSRCGSTPCSGGR